MPSFVDTNVRSWKRDMLKPDPRPDHDERRPRRRRTRTRCDRPTIAAPCTRRRPPAAGRRAPARRAPARRGRTPRRARRHAAAFGRSHSANASKQRADDREAGHRLRHDQPVVHPDVRRERRDPAATSPTGRPRRRRPRRPEPSSRRATRAACRAAPSRSGARARGRVELVADDPRERRVVDEPRHRREHDDRERRVVGRGRRLLAGMRHRQSGSMNPWPAAMVFASEL